MATIILRATKGSPLTNNEVDANFSNINTEVLSIINTLLPLKADLASPTFTGTPSAPTAAVNTSTTQIATTAFVIGQASATVPLVNGTAAIGASVKYARADHVHPTDTTRAPLASPALTGTPTAPTAASGTNTTQVATTAFVVGEVAKAVPRTSTTGSAVIPSGTSAQRDVTPQDGFMRFNTELNQFEGYFNSVWQSVGGMTLPTASTSTAGIVQLSTSTASTSTTLAATASAVKDAYDLAAGKANAAHTHAIADVTGLQTALDGKAASSHNHDAGNITTGTIAAARLPAGSTSAAGIVQLSTSTSSTSTTLAATASAVKAAYDLAASKADASHTHAYVPTDAGQGVGTFRVSEADAVVGTAYAANVAGASAGTWRCTGKAFIRNNDGVISGYVSSFQRIS